MRKPRKLLYRWDALSKSDDAPATIMELNRIYMTFPGKLVEIEYKPSECRCSKDELCYCPESVFDINVYDVDIVEWDKYNNNQVKVDGEYCGEKCPFLKKKDYAYSFWDTRECSRFGFNLYDDHNTRTKKDTKFKRCEWCIIKIDGGK